MRAGTGFYTVSVMPSRIPGSQQGSINIFQMIHLVFIQVSVQLTCNTEIQQSCSVKPDLQILKINGSPRSLSKPTLASRRVQMMGLGYLLLTLFLASPHDILAQNQSSILSFICVRASLLLQLVFLRPELPSLLSAKYAGHCAKYLGQKHEKAWT